MSLLEHLFVEHMAACGSPNKVNQSSISTFLKHEALNLNDQIFLLDKYSLSI